MCGGYDVSSRTASEILSERRLEKVLQVIKIVICNWDIPPIEFLAIFFFFFFFLSRVLACCITPDLEDQVIFDQAITKLDSIMWNREVTHQKDTYLSRNS